MPVFKIKFTLNIVKYYIRSTTKNPNIVKSHCHEKPNAKQYTYYWEAFQSRTSKDGQTSSMIEHNQEFDCHQQQMMPYDKATQDTIDNKLTGNC